MAAVRALLAMLALVLLAGPRPALAAEPLPAWAHTSVNDFAGVLTSDDTRTLDQALIALHDQTGVQGTVVTLADRSRYGDASLEAFATRLFDAWGVGRAAQNDGFMVLVIPSAREARIELGAGYGRDRDIRAGDIMAQVMLPALRAGEISQAARDGTLAVIEQIARPAASGPPVPTRSRGLVDMLLPAAVFGVFGLTGLGMVRSALRRRQARRCPQCGAAEVEDSVQPAPGALPGGIPTTGATQLRRCRSCGWQTRTAIPVPVMLPGRRFGRDERGIRGGGGRGGGFGGGRSGGGGASGRW